MATPHIGAELGDFAPAVLMPGDPKRAERMAGQLLKDAKLVTSVRNVLGFTGAVAAGEHAGKPLSIMASGMGMPSIAIYSTELFRFYGVERIVRVGTAGGISPKVAVGDVVIGFGAHSTSSMNEARLVGAHFSAVADLPMAAAAWAAAAGDPHVFAGAILSEDHFYFKQPGWLEPLVAHGVLAVEMEAACLYGVAAEHGKAALAVLTVSDHLTTGTHANMSAEERESNFQAALRLALAAAFA
ncbi:MAG: purine-nucleoside phosphorylase [Propionibacteriaceae bacterium]|jgi:purine-nucleoside phosphorylase|nr:purine-nucleoside phosphorylase [Propionibacteriaceae bacterium]